jgi:hypothetical protein
MKTQRTYYQLIVDRSGSMTDCVNATIDGFNEQLDRICSMELEFPEQDIRLGVTLFDHRVHHIKVGASISEVVRLNRENYVPNGNTALLDAIGHTIQKLEEMEASPTSVPSTFVLVVLTDGHENSSQIFNLEQIRSRISKLESTGKWTFSFIGATLDALDVAERMAFKRQNSAQFKKESMKGEVWDKLSGSMRGYFTKKKSGGDLSNLFDENI